VYLEFAKGKMEPDVVEEKYSFDILKAIISSSN
jgi:hypothetical protein